MFSGLDPFSVLGASGNPGVPGLGFRYDSRQDWPYPNPTGLEGVMEGYCPPHYLDMRQAVEAVCERFGRGGLYPKLRSLERFSQSALRAEVHTRSSKCVAFQAQYIYDTFGIPLRCHLFLFLCISRPTTGPGILSFHRRSLLRTHAQHVSRWHSQDE
jgi:hypothetical protein